MITDFNSGLHFGHLYKFWLYTAKVTIITWLLHRYYYDLFTHVLILRKCYLALVDCWYWAAGRLSL